MCNDKNEDDESGGGQGDQGGHGTPPTYTPTNRPQRIQTDTPRSDEPPEEQEVSPYQFEEDSEPSLNDFDSFEELSNEYKLAHSEGKWFLFDHKGRFVGKFDTREAAKEEAFRRRPPLSSPHFGM
ncbi:hypothetical protein AFIC_002571 [[Pseudomonas] carboxydohydrogena]|uniref:Uncharacterized protein n=1 Tax=Afipia carboxydohydrogena TaxID=290 RepID=A0ABY8BLZ6_AFICR|nr:hypothetical protein [[Pseudomonas] carboxydohydrogena]WEF51009.1 hypothetical protein AFIC_002571 [[Pseudomonas] carboxydohydrogena]